MVEKSLVKFNVDFISREIPKDKRIEKLVHWCNRLSDAGLLEPYPDQSGSNGNLSFRTEKGKDEFIVTASQLPSKENLEPKDLVKVHSYDLEKGTVKASGRDKPSSESILHYFLYREFPEVMAVFHGHDDLVLEYSKKLTEEGAIETKKEAEMGTTELPESVLEVMKENKDSKYVIMKGHGIVSVGETMDEAGKIALEYHQKAMEMEKEGRSGIIVI